MKTKLALIITLTGCFLCGNIFAGKSKPTPTPTPTPAPTPAQVTALSGAIFTTDSNCSGVDLNIYASKSDVYLNGGPSHPGAAGLPDGSYYVQVSVPGGAVLGQSLSPVVTVASGKFVQCYQLSNIVLSASSGYTSPGFDDTTNPGGEYKAWVSTSANFDNSTNKTDNFKVKADAQVATLCIDKFYDANVNGVKDQGEVAVNGWEFLVIADDNLFLKRFTTPICSVVDTGGYHVIEASSIELNWLHTTLTEAEITLAANDNPTIEFGNVCLGPGGGLTLGFWSNRNGQSLETSSDFSALTALNLRNADGTNHDFSTTLSIAKNDLNNWLLSATATNMSYMLSAQLATMKLNVLHGFVQGGALVYAAGCGNTGVGNDYITITDLMAAADAALATDGYAISGDPNRPMQECLKTALDMANNNLNFVQATPCPVTFSQ